VTDLGFILLGTEAMDISTDGLFLASDRVPRIGEELIVSFKVPGTGMWLDAEAQVARIVRGRRRSDDTAGIGIRFQNMDAITRAILGASLDGHPPPIPSRSLRKDYASSVERITGDYFSAGRAPRMRPPRSRATQSSSISRRPSFGGYPVRL